jgi:hypothetical protein
VTYLGPRKRNTDDTQDILFSDGKNMHEAFQQYSIETLKTTSQHYVSTSGVKTRSEIYKLIAKAPAQIQGGIRERLACSMRINERTYTRNIDSADSGRHIYPSTGQETVQQETSGPNVQYPDQDEEMLCHNAFMKAPSKQVIDSSIEEFIDRTSNSAMAVGVCASCARESGIAELTPHRLGLIPNPHRLQPAVAHPAHDIFSGMLLHPAGVINSETANICMECVRALNADKIPSFSLANGLWIGAIPHELAYLTLPERLLIAKYFPSAYIIKLYPKKKGARHWDNRQMYCGLKGNVSTYQLDQAQIASMIDGTIMPQQAKILAATIGITFVGPKNVPERCLPDNFKVRRARVQRALEWLKQNNPLFANITISESRLAELPENDVPYELRVTTRVSTDINKLHAEQEGYVPSQEACDDEDNESQYNHPEIVF